MGKLLIKLGEKISQLWCKIIYGWNKLISKLLVKESE